MKWVLMLPRANASKQLANFIFLHYGMDKNIQHFYLLFNKIHKVSDGEEKQHVQPWRWMKERLVASRFIKLCQESDEWRTHSIFITFSRLNLNVVSKTPHFLWATDKITTIKKKIWMNQMQLMTLFCLLNHITNVSQDSHRKQKQQ